MKENTSAAKGKNAPGISVRFVLVRSRIALNIVAAARELGGSKGRTAGRLGIDPKTLRAKLRRCGLA